jgi:putative ABC transport system permease protein
MLKNYIKIAWRNLARNKVYSFINILGLSIGIACALLIALFVEHELSFDRFHKKADNLYVVGSKDFRFSSDRWGTTHPQPMGPALKQELTGFKEVVRFSDVGDAIVRYNGNVFTESAQYTDPGFFDMFSFKLLQGNATALHDANSVVLTEALASRFFGDEDPMGKEIEVEVRGEISRLTVTGVTAAPPANSSILYSMLLPMASRPGYAKSLEEPVWYMYNMQTIVELEKGKSPESMSEQLDVFARLHFADAFTQKEEKGLTDNAPAMEIALLPITDVHLSPSISWDGSSNPVYSYILAGIGLLILCIACINYIALALSRASSRSTEVGVRKVIGAYRSHIIRQFWGEAQLIICIALLVGIVLAELALPLFNQLAGVSLSFSLNKAYWFWLLIPGILIVAGLLAGGYPALFISRQKPALMLKGYATQKVNPTLSRVLVVMQYTLSVFLIICSVIMYKQLSYISQKDLGYSSEQVIAIDAYAYGTDKGGKYVELLRNELQQNPAVALVAGASQGMGRDPQFWGIEVENKEKFFHVYGIDEAYLPMLEIPIVAGRNFSASITSDKQAIILNESAVKELGFDDPIGKMVPALDEDSPPVIIGVARDFHFQSLEKEVSPVVLFYKNEQAPLNILLVKVQAGQVPEALRGIEKAWNNIAPNQPYTYRFMDEAVQRQYSKHQRWMKIMGYATGFAILIACMGLFGLAGISALNRVKEVGIRKVLGASAGRIVMLLSKEFVILVCIAIVLATPIAWWAAHKWLDNFAYRVEVGVGTLLIAGGVAIVIALFVVSFQTLKAAVANPVKSLRSE